ncbi:VWA domain-containing protein [Vibrio sp. ZSDE26]|uniref:VWA domain-containing protein n=1 Tax=Vibrio amylolyticus TaxID=2847292 RepID=A0A9X1XJW2_9VIBR|nr:VWA domain-containing protein [Vibrio amylolyticus]MCK6263475.1 VWA domain-containing protein [Vibrio amylolyticus]
MTLMTALENFHFLRPIWLLVLMPIFALIAFNWHRDAKQNAWTEKLPKHLLKALLVEQPSWTSRVPIKTLSFIVFVAVLVASGPSWHRSPMPFGENTTPLVVVLDASSSMQQQDLAPSRLFRAKQKILELLELRSGGSTALIVYSGSAHTAMPLTQDIEIYRPLLESISPEVMPRKGKFAEYTLPIIEQVLTEVNPAASILLVTDAVNTKASKAYRDYFSEKPYQLLVYGIGNEAMTTPYPMEKKALSSLAKASGGQFVPFTQDSADIETLESKIEAFAVLSGGEAEPWYDSGHALIWLIILPYLLWFRKGWLVKWGLVLVVCNAQLLTSPVYASEFTWRDVWLTNDQQGALEYNKENYNRAAELFENERWKADSYYRAGEYDIAQQFYMRSDDIESKLGAAAALAHMKEYIAAKQLYDEILENDPSIEVATSNLFIVNSIIKHIDTFTKSQSNSNEQQSSKERGDKPKSSEGVLQEIDRKQLIKETLSAEAILNDPSVNEKWMKRVESDLSMFISTKFSLQLEQGKGRETEWRND